jgi:FG-GAP repeat
MSDTPTHDPFSYRCSGSRLALAMGDLNKDGWPDVVIGAMDIGNVARLQRRFTGDTLQTGKNPLVFFENRMRAKSNTGR